MRIIPLVLAFSAACTEPRAPETEQDPGTQVGEEGDDLRCIEVREEVPLDDTRHGSLDLSPRDVIALAETPVSGELALGGDSQELQLALTHAGSIWYAHDEPRDEQVDPSECNIESYYAQVSGTLVAGDLLDETFESEVWSFQAGHVYVGARFDLEDLAGSLEPQRIDPDTWDNVSLHAFGGSTDGVWAFHLDWDAAMAAPGETDRESIADLSLYPE